MSSTYFQLPTESSFSHTMDMKTMASKRDSGIFLPSPPPEEQIHIPETAAASDIRPVNPEDPPVVAVIGVGYVGTVCNPLTTWTTQSPHETLTR